MVLGGLSSSAQATIWGLPSLGNALGPSCTPSGMHVGSATILLSTWCGRSSPGNTLLLSLPRLRPWGPHCFQVRVSRAQRAEFRGSHPISGDPTPWPGSPWPPCLPWAEPPCPQRVGGWCPTAAGTPGRGLSAPRPPCPPGWTASSSARCPQLCPSPCVHSGLGPSCPPGPRGCARTAEFQLLRLPWACGHPGLQVELGRTGWGPPEGPGTASPSAPGPVPFRMTLS